MVDVGVVADAGSNPAGSEVEGVGDHGDFPDPKGSVSVMGGGWHGEVAATEGEDVEELVREDVEGAKARILSVGRGIEEKEVAKRLHGERSRGGGGFKLEAHHVLRWFLGFTASNLWFEIWGWGQAQAWIFHKKSDLSRAQSLKKKVGPG